MRTNKDTSDVLLALAANKSVGCATGAVTLISLFSLISRSHTRPPVAHQLLKPLKSQSAWRPVLSRLQIIIQLLQDNGMTPESGFTVDSVMTFCVASFDSANGQVIYDAPHRLHAILILTYALLGALNCSPACRSCGKSWRQGQGQHKRP